MDEKLVSTKLSKADREKASEPMAMDAPEYPWGMRLRFEKDLVDKLGLKDLPAVGTEIKIEAVICVEENWSREAERGADRGFCAVVCEIGLDNDEDDKPSGASVMYGDG